MDLKRLKDTPPWHWPDDAGAQVLAVLEDRDADPEDRLLAAELAGDFIVASERVARALLSLVRATEEPGELRGRAAISLGPVLEHTDIEGFGPISEPVINEETFDEIVEALRTLYSDSSIPDDVRRRILEASVRAPRDWHREAVTEALRSDAPPWRVTAVFAMRWLEGFGEQILAALDNDDPAIRYQALCAAGAWELRGAWRHVERILADPSADKDLLLAAIEAAAVIRPGEASALLADLTHADDEDIREAASEALMMSEGGPSAGLDDLEREDDDDDGRLFH